MKKYALVIGNSDYKDARLSKLVKPGVDARGLAEVLRAKEIGAFDRVTTLINKSEKTVRLAIAYFCAQKKLDDLLLLYFSGHGVLDEQGQLHFAMRDTDSTLLSVTAVPASFVRERLNSSNSRTQVLMLDCCHSGAFARAAKGALGASVDTKAAFDVTGYGRVVLTATDATQYAWEGDQNLGQAEPSVFTRYLIQGLKTGAADSKKQGYITLNDLYRYVYEQVLSARSNQTPLMFAEKQKGDIIIAKNPHPAVMKLATISLVGRDGRLFAGTSFRVDNTSQIYYQSPYFQEHKNQLQPIPLPRIDPPRMNLADVFEKAGIQAIRAAKTITFHAVGDTGDARQTVPKKVTSVANMMAADVQAGGASAPAFFFHLGDVIFYFAESKYYYDQFYAPFQDYDRPIFAIPGNHDGSVYDAAVPTLQAFLRNFCAPQPGRSADAGEHTRSVMTQPGAYFTLDAPFVSIIGLYSNVHSGPGVISSQGGKPPIGDTQLRFLQAELQRLKPARTAGERAIIVAVHHPPLSGQKHGGSPDLSNDIDRACLKAGLWPDAILSSHAHLYQRFTRSVGNQQIPYIVCGTGGYGRLRPFVQTPKAPFTLGDYMVEIDPVFEFGYLTVTVEMTTVTKQLIIAFHSPNLGRNVDQITVDLGKHLITKNAAEARTL